jgi:hypothetical protein
MDRISMNDVTTSDAPTGARRMGVDVLKYRESHGGKAPWETAATDGAGAGARGLTGIELLKYREAHGGLTPSEVAAKDAQRSTGSRR